MKKITNKLIITLVSFFIMMIWVTLQGPAHATTIDFSTDQYGNPLSAGDVITNQYDDLFNLTVDSNGSHDIGMVFDSGNPTGGDPDLATPSTPGNGNAWNQSLGNLLIISEDGDSSDPDDEVLGGTLVFDFVDDLYRVDSFGFHLVDIEASEMYSVSLFSESDSALFQPLTGDGLVFGDNSINEFDAYLAANYGWTYFDKVEVHFGGSGAIDNIQLNTTPVPEPATLVLLGIGLMGFAGVSRKKLGNLNRKN
jgi:hypothetical protein